MNSLLALIGNRPLHKRTRNRIRPIQNDDFDSCLRGRLQKISRRSFVGVKARARIRQIDHHRIQPLQHVQRRTPRRVARPVDAVDRDSGRRILGILDVGRVQRSCHPMFRTENRIQRNAGHVGQHVNRSASFGIDAGLIRQQSDASRSPAPGRMQRRELRLLEHVNSRLHRSIPHRQLARRALHFVVAGDRLRFASSPLRRDRAPAPPPPRSRPSSAARPRFPSPSSCGGHHIHVHRVRQQHDISLRCGIDPQRSPRESRMPVTAHGQQFSAVGGKRRIDVPAKSPQRRSIHGLLWRGHLRDRRRSQHASPAIEQSLRKNRQIVGGGKYSRMTRHAAHPAGRGIVHHSAQQMMVLILFGGSDAVEQSAPTTKEDRTASPSFRAAQKYASPHTRRAARPKSAPPALPALRS